MEISCFHALELKKVEQILAALSQGCLIVWVRLADVEALGQANELSHCENVRASGFRTELARSEFIAGRKLVRSIVGRMEGCSAVDVDINVDSRGKPTLGRRHRPNFSFSISHSAGYVAVAFAYGVDLGLDIEFSEPTIENFARHFLTKEEFLHVLAVSPEERQAILLRLWRAKEALLKAFGVGFFEDPCSVEVLKSLGPVRLGPTVWQDRIWHLEEKALDGEADSTLAWSIVR